MISSLSALLIGAGVVLICTTSGLLVRIWRVRHSFDMAARSPTLLIYGACAALIMALLVLLHWILLLEGGRGLTCYATFWATYFWYSAGITSYTLRAVRLVVIFHSEYRYKYAKLVKRKNLQQWWASNSLSIIVLASILFGVSGQNYRTDYGCAFFEETAALGVVTALLAPLFSFMLYKLLQVNDAFKLRRELLWVFLVSFTLAGAYMTIQVLYKTGTVQESRTIHLILEVVALCIMLNALFWVVLVSVALHDGWCGLGMSRVIPSEGWSGRSPAPSSCLAGDGVLQYFLEGGMVASLFERFCKRHLCAESWDFIVEVCKYEVISHFETQFDTFAGITKKYLQPASPQEVNISGKMQAKIALLLDKDKFSALDEGSRRDVLKEPLKEIAKMLEENLLAKFERSPEMLRWRQDLRLENLLIEHENSAAAEGDENMREQLLVCSSFIEAGSRRRTNEHT